MIAKKQAFIDAAYQTFLKSVYQNNGLISQYNQSEREQFELAQVSYIYGELLFPSLMKILKTLVLTEADNFLDLGSGMGNLVLGVYLRTRLKEVIGIEASPTLHAHGIKVLQKVFDAFPKLRESSRTLRLLQGNFLQYDFNRVSIIYTCSTCFTQELMWLIGEKMNRAPLLRQVISLKPIASLTRLPLKKIISIECSWDSALAYYYHNL